MKIEFLNNLLNKIKRNNENDFASIFPKHNFQKISDLKKYPCVISLVEDNTYAYRMFFCADKKFSQGIIDLINEEFESNITFENTSDTLLFLKNEAIVLNVYNDFEGEVVRIITNSEIFVRKLWELKITPPPPWISFPEIDPDGLGSMQGNLSFWWDWMWLPFWNSMDTSEKKYYLIAHSAPLNWIEYFDFYDTYINK
ncbi:hypothetical protein [Serratia oryzae]|uniref:Uncharacterized protein n=1 Tax=Serratia oryzae TaxID=2034155 RepID=A0A1S8CD48_9GAMM|nr:hypothetical protein [Serratia oryzae]OMQ18214.1 hypothetical protein BMI79_21980 [Serratia oryzae]